MTDTTSPSSKILRILSVLNLLILITDGLSTPSLSSKCQGIKIDQTCVTYDKSISVTHQSHCWYDLKLKDCVVLSQNCILPNHNVTFTSLQQCLDTCSNSRKTSTSSAEKEKDSQPNIDCDTNRGKCDNDLAPTSQTSLSFNSVSLIASIVCSVGLVGIAVVIVIAAVHKFRQKRKKDQQRKQIEDMLNTLTDPNGDDDDDFSDESILDDNAEENNLFDRLEERFW